MNLPPVVSQSEWEEALAGKQLTRSHDELAAERRRLPRVAFDKQYVFEGPAGETALIDFFERCRQLIVYHFMFHPSASGWPDAGCDGCSMFVDQVTDLAHLRARVCDTAFALVSPEYDGTAS